MTLPDDPTGLRERVQPELVDAAAVLPPTGSPDGEEGDGEQVTRPTKLIRIATMVRSMLDEVRRLTSSPDTVVNVVIPELIVSHWWELPLHNQNALFVKRLFLQEPRVVLTSVPLSLRPAGTRSPAAQELTR